MFYGTTPQEIRQVYFSSWQKYKLKQALQPLEEQLISVILDHPEYHSILDKPEIHCDQDYPAELGQTNPFLHMGLHLAIRDQLSMDRPIGILSIYNNLIKKYADRLEVEHLILNCLAECLWEAQRNNCPPDENAYLQTLERL